MSIDLDGLDKLVGSYYVYTYSSKEYRVTRFIARISTDYTVYIENAPWGINYKGHITISGTLATINAESPANLGRLMLMIRLDKESNPSFIAGILTASRGGELFSNTIVLTKIDIKDEIKLAIDKDDKKALSIIRYLNLHQFTPKFQPVTPKLNSQVDKSFRSTSLDEFEKIKQTVDELKIMFEKTNSEFTKIKAELDELKDKSKEGKKQLDRTERQRLKDIIGKGKLKRVIEELLIQCKNDNDRYNQLIMLSGRYHIFQTERTIGVLNKREADISINILQRDVIIFIDEL